MGLGRKLASNSAYLFMDWVVATLMGFVYWIIAGKLLLPAEYGIVTTSFNLASILSGISLLGLGSAAWKLIPEYLVKRRGGKIISLVRFSFKTILASNFVIILVFFLMAGQLSSVMNMPSLAVILTGVMILMISLSSQAGMIMYGFQQMRKFFLSDLWGHTSKVVLSALLLLTGFGYMGPIIGLISWFAVVAFLRFLSIPLRGRMEKINERRIMAHYSLPALITFVSVSLFLSGQYVLLTSLQGTRETGIYSVAMILITPIVVIPGTLTGAIVPITSELSASRDVKRQRSRLIGMVLRYSLFVTLPIMFFLVIFSRQAILVFSRAEYLPASQLFPLLGVSSIVYGLGSLLLNNIYAIGKTKINRDITIAVTAIFFATAIPMIRMFSSFGLAVSYGVSVTALFLMSYIYLKRYLRIGLPWGDVAKLVIAGLSSLSLVYVLSALTEGLVMDLFLVVLGGAVYLLLLAPLGFYKEEDEKLLGIVAEKFPRMKKLIGLFTRIIRRSA